MTKRIEALVKNKRGFSMDLQGETTMPVIGYAVAITDNMIDFNKPLKKQIKEVVKAAKVVNTAQTVHIGGRYDTINEQYFLDLSIFVNRKHEALQLGKTFNQKAIWDFDTCEAITVQKR